MKKYVFFSIIVFSAIITGCSKLPNLGDGYRFYSDGKYTLQIVNSQNTVMISSHILEYAFDSTFIIASQRPWDSIPNIRTMNYKASNDFFERSTFQQYWIINKKEKNEYAYNKAKGIATYSNVYGPYKKDEYIRKREELRVSNQLQL